MAFLNSKHVLFLYHGLPGLCLPLLCGVSNAERRRAAGTESPALHDETSRAHVRGRSHGREHHHRH